MVMSYLRKPSEDSHWILR